MLISLISLLLLAAAVYFLVRTKPNLFLFDLMRDVCGETTFNQSEDDKKAGEDKTCNDTPLTSK
jgi:hypothetical protein